LPSKNKHNLAFRLGVWFLATAGSGFAAQAAQFPNIVEQWNTVQPPPPPTLQAVDLAPASTALLVLDMTGAQDPHHGPCNPTNKMRCLEELPGVAQLLANARAHHVYVVYSVTSSSAPSDIATSLAPLPGDPVVRSGPDKFVGTDLAKLLKAHYIHTVVIVGTASEGAVLDTATDAVLREKMQAVVPVDGMSSTTLFGEQAVAWDLLNAPGVIGKVTLSRTDMITF
jgi:nicotinamidase-related amidase